MGFPDTSVGKESDYNAGDPSSIPGSGRSAGEGIGYPLQYSWASLVAQLVKNLPLMRETWVWSLGWEDPLEEGKGYPTPVFWPGEFHGLYSPWGCKESDMTEQLSLIVNNAAANIGVQVSAESLPLIILGTYLEVELLDHMIYILLIFCETAILFSITVSFYILCKSTQAKAY